MAMENDEKRQNEQLYIISIMTNLRISVIVITVKSKADWMSPERKESWQQLISREWLRILST